MVDAAPPIDERTAPEIAWQVVKLLQEYKLHWQQLDPITGQVKKDLTWAEFGATPLMSLGASAALIGIFARFAELIIQRLNQAPAKNFLAYLDLLGATLTPPQPARAPLIFSLAAGSVTDAVVPAGTQVAAPPTEGQATPVIFETERELVVTAAQLASIFARDPHRDQVADLSPLINAPATPGLPWPSLPIFQDDFSLQPSPYHAVEHSLYLGDTLLLGLPYKSSVGLTFTLDKGLGDGANINWQIWDGKTWIDLVATAAPQLLSRSTRRGSRAAQSVGPLADLTQPGAQQITFGVLPASIPLQNVNGLNNRWLRGVLNAAILPDADAAHPDPTLTQWVRESLLPQVRQLQMVVTVNRSVDQGLQPDAAFTNATPIDLTKDFFPFGERPKFNDAFYLASAEAFAREGVKGEAVASASATLSIQVINTHLLTTPSSVRPSPDLRLAWEVWDGAIWQRVGTSVAPDWLSTLEVDLLPPATSDTSVIVQGVAERGTVVSITRPPEASAVAVATASEDRRFAASAPLNQGLNIFQLTATRGAKTSTAWAVIVRGAPSPIQLNAASTNLPGPTTRATIPLTVTVANDSTNQVKSIRVTNGNNPAAPITGNPATALTIPLSAGRNELLIEGLGTDNRTPLVATTLMIGRLVGSPKPDAKGFADGAYAFCQPGLVTFTLPATVNQIAVNGQTNYWLRVRLESGNYGADVTYKLKNPLNPADGFILIPASFRVPILSPLHIGYDQTLSRPPEVALTYNNLTFDDVTAVNRTNIQPFAPFARTPEFNPTLLLGFTLPSTRPSFPNRTISLYVSVAKIKYVQSVPTHAARRGLTPEEGLSSVDEPISAGPLSDTDSPPAADAGARGLSAVERSMAAMADQQPQLTWDYWNGNDWSPILVRDETQNFTQPGLIEFLAPADLDGKHIEFGLTQYWLRISWRAGKYTVLPKLNRLLLNTTMATQAVTIRNEILGSSNGAENQLFQSTQAPILEHPHLEVREPEQPSAGEKATLEKEEGSNAVRELPDATGRFLEIWVRWHPVRDFYASGPRDRHYVLNHLTGEVRFGNGVTGLIPPTGTGNLRLALYQTGGGRVGNQPAGAIVQLKTTVPYIDKATNPEPAAGGADVETLEELIARAPRIIRHRGYAVTREDYEDLAQLASPEVARARCAPLANLSIDPDALLTQPGIISLIVTPHADDTRPTPTFELLNRVKNYINLYNSPLVDLVVVGPEYVGINVTAELALISLEGAGAVDTAVRQALAQFLHPLTGGFDGKGWDFGRQPQKSDLYALLESIPNVDHVRFLNLTPVPDRLGADQTDRFLVYSGTHQITLLVEPT